MKNTAITISFDEEKLAAARIYMEQKNLSVEQELIKTIDGMYTKYVPSNVREFLEIKNLKTQGQKRKVTRPEQHVDGARSDLLEQMER